MVIIKRYANRKLYNTQTRSYITLDEIAAMMQQGQEIKVTDHLTGTDMTAATMTQVLAHQEKEIGGLVPQALLERMVQLSGLTLYSMRESIKAFMDPAAYMAADITRRLDILLQSSKITPDEYAHLQSLLFDPELEPVFIKTDENEEGATMEELQALLSQIEKLESEIAAVEKAKTKNTPVL